MTHHDAKHAVRNRHDRVPRPAVLGRKELGRDGIQHAVHDVARERVAAVPAEQRVGRPRGSGAEEEDASEDWSDAVCQQKCRNRECGRTYWLRGRVFLSDRVLEGRPSTRPEWRREHL